MPARRLGLVAALAAVVLAGCGGQPRREIRQDVIANRMPSAERRINALYHHHLAEYGDDAEQVGNSRHLLLWRLERATIDLLQGEPLNALAHLREAARVAREYRTRSAARAVGAAVINDNLTRWSGEPFELARIPYYAMLADLGVAQRLDGTLVDGVGPGRAERGAASEPAAVEDAATHADRAASAAIALAEELRRIGEGQHGATAWRAHGWLHLAAAAVRHATAVDGDDAAAAALYAQRAAEAYRTAGGIPPVAQALIDRIAERTGPGMPPPGHGSVLVIEEVGFVPKREELTVWVFAGAPPHGAAIDLGGVFVWVDDPNSDALKGLDVLPVPGSLVRALAAGRFGMFGCEVPVLPRRGARPGIGAVSVDDGAPLPLDPVEDVEEAARTCFDDHRARRLAAIIVRTAGKLIATRQAVGTIQVDGRRSPEAQALRDLLWGLGSALVTVSEQADTRCWTLLPNRVAAQLVHVPAGPRSLAIVAADGRPRHLGRIDVRPGALAIVLVRTFPAGTDHVGAGR